MTLLAPRTILLSLLLAAASGCGDDFRGRIVTPSDIANRTNTRVTRQMTGGYGERPPRGLPSSLTMDEAWLTRFTRRKVCFDLLVRTPADVDVPLSQWDVDVNGKPIYVDDEAVVEQDYPFVADVTVYEPLVVVRPKGPIDAGPFEVHVPRIAIGEAPRRERREGAFRVVGRRVAFCTKNEVRGDRVRLHLGLRVPGTRALHEIFEWKVVADEERLDDEEP